MYLLLQDGQGGHVESSMDTSEWNSNSQAMKAGSAAGFNLFDNTSNPPSVDDLLQSTTDFIASTNTMSISDGECVCLRLGKWKHEICVKEGRGRGREDLYFKMYGKNVTLELTQIFCQGLSPGLGSALGRTQNLIYDIKERLDNLGPEPHF